MTGNGGGMRIAKIICKCNEAGKGGDLGAEITILIWARDSNKLDGEEV